MLSLAPTASAADLIGQASIVDGDTIEIYGQRIRLFGIDAPEHDQLCETAGTQHDQLREAAARPIAPIDPWGGVRAPRERSYPRL